MSVARTCRTRMCVVRAGLALGSMVAVAAVAAEPSDLDPRVVKILEAVSPARMKATVERLQGFGTRHTLSGTDSPTRGIGAARQWILDELQRSSPRLQVAFDTYQVPKQGERITRDVELRNVVGVLPGRGPRRLYVTAHYDSVARATDKGAAPSAGGGFDWTVTDNDAPGADDDGSGTALVLELARVFAESGTGFDATLVFALFAGEEEGLVGSTLHAQKVARAGLAVDAVLNNDIVGSPTGGDGVVDAGSVRVFSEGPEDSASRQLARFVLRQAARYVPAHHVRLIARHDRFGRGGDHTPFNQHGYAAVRFCESRENYSRQHTALDTADAVQPEYLAANARVNAAALAALALAPPAPVVADEKGRPLLDRQPSGYDARLRWLASPGAASYRIFWREAWTPDWQQERDVGNVTEVVLRGLSIDDHVFGVAAVGPDGHESLVTAYVNPPRPALEIKPPR
jgi:Peptidase family M28